MSFFRKNAVSEIRNGVRGHLVDDHNVNVASIHSDYRSVQKPLVAGSGCLMRIFRLSEARKGGVHVVGWDTFDTYPDLIVFEGFLMGDKAFQAHMVRRKA